VLLALCYAPWDCGGLVWAALIPLVCAAWFAPRTTRPFLLGYVAGLVFFTTTFHWLGALGKLYETPLLYGLPLLLAAYLALYPAAWAWFLARVLAPTAEARRFPNSWWNLGAGALAASAWTTLEWARGWMLSGFGWNGLGVALHRDLPMIQIAEFTGTLGLSWLVAFANVMGVIVVRRIIGDFGPGFLSRVRWEFSLTVALVMLVFGYGVRKLMTWKPVVRSTVSIAAIQPNVPQVQKFDPVFEDHVFDTLERLTLMAAATRPGIILWPESATPRGIYADQGTYDRVLGIVQEADAVFLIGSIDDEVQEDATLKAYNIAALLAPPTLPSGSGGPYRKIHLVPFGEYLPLRLLLDPIAGGLVPGDFSSGGEFTVFKTPPGSMAALICFEDTLGNLTRKFFSETQSPPNLLVNLTNDGWFLRTCGAEQHLANAVLRAVENRRPLLRCGNTGVTGLVHPTGRIDRWMEPHREGFSVKPVAFIDGGLTLYSQHGDWLAWPVGALTLGALVWRFRKLGR
jgi:apolipoprotein N-acyltransferase